MTKVAWNITIDSELKEYIKAQADKEGLKASQYIHLLARSSREQRIPLIDFDLVHTEEDEKAYQEALVDLKNGDTFTLEEVREMLDKKEKCTT